MRSEATRAEAWSNCSPVMWPSATRASPRRSFLRLLAANTMRPLSKKRVFTALPDWTCRSPLLRAAARERSVSAMGVVPRSVSMKPLDITGPIPRKSGAGGSCDRGHAGHRMRCRGKRDD